MSLVYLPQDAWSLRYGVRCGMYTCDYDVTDVLYTTIGAEYFTAAITDYMVKENEYALYELEIQNGRRSWKILRRFSEFDRLLARYDVSIIKHDSILTTLFVSVRFKAGNRVPKLPPKTYCCHDLNPDFLARRKNLLQDFLQHLLQIPGIADDDHVREFLGLKLSAELYV